jgi:hypothetical protein
MLTPIQHDGQGNGQRGERDQGTQQQGQQRMQPRTVGHLVRVSHPLKGGMGSFQRMTLCRTIHT